MQGMPRNALIWLKRDLRLNDQAPLSPAADFNAPATLYMIEPPWRASPGCDGSQVAFVLDGLAQFRVAVAGCGLSLLAEPWRLAIGQQRVAGCLIGENYPAPLIEERSAPAHATTQMHDARRVLDARREAAAIQEQHGSSRGAVARSPGNRPGTSGGTTIPNPQGDLSKS